LIGRLISRLVGTVGCIVILVVVVGLIAALAFGGMFVEQFFASPGDSVGNYASAVARNDVGDAYGHLCRDYRERRTQAQFAQDIERQRVGLGPIQGSTVTDTIPRGVDRLSVYFRLRGTARSREIEATVIREDSRWRICDFDWQGDGD
jgi:hypothetical protein